MLKSGTNAALRQVAQSWIAIVVKCAGCEIVVDAGLDRRRCILCTSLRSPDREVTRNARHQCPHNVVIPVGHLMSQSDVASARGERQNAEVCGCAQCTSNCDLNMISSCLSVTLSFFVRAGAPRASSSQCCSKLVDDSSNYNSAPTMRLYAL
jgi:hypothetical protein